MTPLSLLVNKLLFYIDCYHKKSTDVCKTLPDGLHGRVPLFNGVLCFDMDIGDKIEKVKREIKTNFPELQKIIEMSPEYLYNYRWTRADYLYLYCEHLKLIIYKIRQDKKNGND